MVKQAANLNGNLIVFELKTYECHVDLWACWKDSTDDCSFIHNSSLVPYVAAFFCVIEYTISSGDCVLTKGHLGKNKYHYLLSSGHHNDQLDIY